MAKNIRDAIRPNFDKLNGKETVERTFEITALSTVVGAGLSAFTLSVVPRGLGEAAVWTGALTASCAAVGAIFAVTTNVSASVRGKDTPLNYLIGGCASGLFIGARTKNFSVGSASCAALGGWGAFYKLWKKNDWGPIIPDRKY